MQARAHRWFRRHRGFSSDDLDAYRRIIQKINRLADRADRISEEAGGDHGLGHEMINTVYHKFDTYLQHPMPPDDNPLKDELSAGHGLLDLAGYHIFLNGYPVPHLLLAEMGWWLQDAVKRYMCGPRHLMQPFSPAHPRLVMDRAGRMVIDATGLYARLAEVHTRDRSWHGEFAMVLFADIIRRQHEYFQKNRYHLIGTLCRLYGLQSALQVLRFKAYCDYLLLPEPEGFIRERAIRAMVETGVFGETLSADLAPYRHDISEKLHTLVAGKVEKTVAQPLRRSCQTAVRTAGALTQRSTGSVQMGSMTRREIPPPVEWVDIDHRASALIDELNHALMSKRRDPHRAAPGKRGFSQGIDISDLDGHSAMKKYMAAARITEGFLSFLDTSGIGALYDELRLEPPDTCPMPYEGGGIATVDIRLKAAVCALFLSELGNSPAHRMPDHLFQLHAPKHWQEDQKNAYEQIHNQVKDHVNRFLTLVGLQRTYPGCQGLVEAWVTFFEIHTIWIGSGVDSVSDLLFPAFFFSDDTFDELLRYECPYFKKTWARIRLNVILLRESYVTQNWADMRKAVETIFKAFRMLSLRLAKAKDLPGKNNPLLPNRFSPFQKPQNFFSKKSLVVQDARSPFEIVVAGPGDPAAYGGMIDDNRAYILYLKQLETYPQELRANVRGYSKSGAIFDLNRIHAIKTGHCIYSSIHHRTAPVPGRKYAIVILMDFSGSMNRERVAAARAMACILAEGLRHRFDVLFYLYNTAGSLFRMTQIFDSRNRATHGQIGLTSLARKDFQEGTNWNPDAAAVLAVRQILDKAEDTNNAVIIHLGDHEWCTSLSVPALPNAQAEMEYAVDTLVRAGYRYVLARVNTDEDLLALSGIAHHYVFIPGSITKEKIKEIYGILTEAMDPGICR